MLLAFEASARNGSLTRAAGELGTSQSALSRRIADLEGMLSARLFKRSHTGVRLTTDGGRYLKAVVSGLGLIHSTAEEIAGNLKARITIACAYEVSHLFVMPRLEALQQVVGDEVSVNVTNHDYDRLNMEFDPQVDLAFTYGKAVTGPDDRAVAYDEAITLLCSPAYAAAHAETLHRPVADWRGLTFLKLGKRNHGWVNLDDWFEAVGRPDSQPRFVQYDNYVFMLEAAVSGKGLVLGWRGFVERYLDVGVLVQVGDGFVEFDRPHFVVLTEKGRWREPARRCLEYFARPPD